MLFSMTAFARCTREGEVGRITWEMRSVNHRYAEIYFRMPEDFRGLESDLRTILLDRLKRGKIDCNLRVEPNETTTNSLVVNQTLARSVVTAAGQIASMTVDGGAPDPMEILKWPGVLKVEKLDAQQISLEIRRAFEDAVDQLVATRRREGEKLDDLIGQRCDGIAAQVTALRTRVPEIMDLIHERYVQRLQDYLQDLDKGRVEQECALLMQKLDVAEELDRLDAHVEEVRRVLEQGSPAGRRLDFLMQELNREANTVGSKSSHIDTSTASVELKVLIEQMREQIQNVE
ncbi:MAG: YicC/YloC family endoribonuclease [Gammaproteobacteria bacterium]|nr:YicC/YloC family endoribonuclease [Gammaproteobacteria bacterium]